MITEDYVSFEVAKLLKEKGFNLDCHAYYIAYADGTNKFNISAAYPYGYNFNDGEDYQYSATTLQMAMKWLRIEHNIHIEILMTNHSMSERFDIPKYYWVAVGAKTSKWITESTLYSAKQFDTNEEACEAAFKHCLTNLIK